MRVPMPIIERTQQCKGLVAALHARGEGMSQIEDDCSGGRRKRRTAVRVVDWGIAIDSSITQRLM